MIPIASATDLLRLNHRSARNTHPSAITKCISTIKKIIGNLKDSDDAKYKLLKARNKGDAPGTGLPVTHTHCWFDTQS